jgi:predicted translin family RNA/ssDNA-binding protein
MKEDLKNLFLKAGHKLLDITGEIVKESTEDVIKMASNKISQATEKSKRTISDKEEINRLLKNIKSIKNKRF